ncbi:antibiotic biosynthesis monooxygenase family protein [Catenibacterium mitsuokai]|uniref:antibiotic biosynthesis monooxygenase family protein n=1 Tax=Catenibacterium mitsuokai TaxID=100886 RepID=UPI003CFBCB01
MKENKILSMTVWENEESIEVWRNFKEHRLSQKVGRDCDFIDYKITVLNTSLSYSMNDRKEAPIDSNDYFGV